MEEPKDQKDESWIVVKYFVKLTTWLAAMKPDLVQKGFNSNDNTAEELVEKTFEELLDGWEWVRSPKEVCCNLFLFYVLSRTRSLYFSTRFCFVLLSPLFPLFLVCTFPQ